MKTKIREYRTRKGLTQRDLAAAAGVRRETIVSLEGGGCNPSLRLAHAIAKVLGARIDTLFLFEDDPDIVLEE